MTLWLPPGTDIRKHCEIVDEDKKMPDGRILRSHGIHPQLPGKMHHFSTSNGLQVLASIDDCSPHGDLLHVSVSLRAKNPSWEEIAAVRYLFYPADVDAMMILPAKDDYVNFHAHTFHLYQTPTTWGIQ